MLQYDSTVLTFRAMSPSGSQQPSGETWTRTGNSRDQCNGYAVLCSFPWWKKAAEYYPMSLVKTAELDSSKSYVFGFHPHGIISMSAFVAFATEGLNVSKVFPGIHPNMQPAPQAVAQ